MKDFFLIALAILLVITICVFLLSIPMGMLISIDRIGNIPQLVNWSIAAPSSSEPSGLQIYYTSSQPIPQSDGTLKVCGYWLAPENGLFFTGLNWTYHPDKMLIIPKGFYEINPVQHPPKQVEFNCP